MSSLDKFCDGDVIQFVDIDRDIKFLVTDLYECRRRMVINLGTGVHSFIINDTRAFVVNGEFRYDGGV